MAENSGISWTDHTFNPWIGCSKVSPACKFCYAERDMDHRFGKVAWGPNGTRSKTSEANWKQPLKWNREAECLRTFDCNGGDHSDCCPQKARPRVFCASLADVFEQRDLVYWADVSDGYRVSIRGEIESQWRPGGTRGEWKRMATRLDKGGYETVQLRRHPTDGHRTLKVHKIVLEAFVGKCPPGRCVRHIDGAASNNVLWNLAYSTQSENLKDRELHGTSLRREINGRAKLTKEQVDAIKAMCAAGDSHESVAATFGVVQSTVSKIIRGDAWIDPKPGPQNLKRHAARGQIIDHKGRPLFVGDQGLSSHDPGGDSRNWVPLCMDDLRRDLFRLIDATPHLDWLLLTKRPENVRRMILDCAPSMSLAKGNVWLGTSVENQEQADKRIPELLKCRDLSPVLFLSCEPLLGSVDLFEAGAMMATTCICREPWKTRACANERCHKNGTVGTVDWVIAGGESGPNARPSHPDWFRSLRDQCAAADVSFHFKQWGEWGTDSCDRESGSGVWLPDGRFVDPYDLDLDGTGVVDTEKLVWSHRVGRKAAGSLLDGVTHDAFPEVGRG